MEFYDPMEGVWTNSEDIMNQCDRVDLDVNSIPDSDTREDDLIDLMEIKNMNEAFNEAYK